jgi:hypothetical protein
LVEGRLTLDEARGAELHLDRCDACSWVVSELARGDGHAGGEVEADPAEGRAGSGTLAPGTRVGRYAVARPLGAGSGGIVYEAFDHELQRKVGLKLLRADPAPGMSAEEAQARLLREARTMARLAHPNVVTVHDAGTFEGQVFIVMQLVEGETLTEWLRVRPREWREILDVFVAAGRGLAAAHVAKLVHHDFKPDNVLVGADGIIRVTDFGLAEPLDRAETAAGAPVVGTPAFMAPEVRRRRPADARSDQFGFCVALRWALEGRRPFRPRSADPSIKAARIPDWLEQTLRRGLNENPAERFESMEALLAALSGPPPSRTGRAPSRRVALAAAVLSGIALLLLAVRWRSTRPVPASPAIVPPPPAAASQPLGPSKLVLPIGRLRAFESCEPRAPRPGSATRPSSVMSCFTFDKAPVAWRAAREACRLRGGDLATCVSRTGCDRMSATVPADRMAWIGLWAGPPQGRFAWISGEPLEAHLADERLDATEIGKAPTDDPCVALAQRSDIPPSGSRPWTVRGCDQRLGSLCEWTPWRISIATRRAYRVLANPMSWDEAAAACAELGAHLAAIEDAEEQAFVEANVFRSSADRHSPVWLGGRRDREGRFRWLTGEPFAYVAFAQTEPDNVDGNQHCLVLSPTTRRWHDRSCEGPYFPVCEAGAPPPSSGSKGHPGPAAKASEK